MAQSHRDMSGLIRAKKREPVSLKGTDSAVPTIVISKKAASAAEVKDPPYDRVRFPFTSRIIPSAFPRLSSAGSEASGQS